MGLLGLLCLGVSGLGDEAPEFDLCDIGWSSRLEVAMKINPINWGAAFLWVCETWYKKKMFSKLLLMVHSEEYTNHTSACSLRTFHKVNKALTSGTEQHHSSPCPGHLRHVPNYNPNLWALFAGHCVSGASLANSMSVAPQGSSWLSLLHSVQVY